MTFILLLMSLFFPINLQSPGRCALELSLGKIGKGKGSPFGGLGHMYLTPSSRGLDLFDVKAQGVARAGKWVIQVLEGDAPW
jgi:hypothetical protein